MERLPRVWGNIHNIQCVYVRQEITRPGRRDLDKGIDSQAAVSTYIPVNEHGSVSC